MTKLYPLQWPLRPMVAAAMAVIVVNCAGAVDAATTIPSMASTAVAKTPSPPLPLTMTAFAVIDYCH